MKDITKECVSIRLQSEGRAATLAVGKGDLLQGRYQIENQPCR